jgi:serine/threonine protein kinase/tetratricopeptide (TPR) repeat protein
MISRANSHYQIVEKLGEGGMGEVYLAQDTRLGRMVALKLLPSQFTEDLTRMRRFQQEARAVSSLNHPNILTIYEIGEADNEHFIAMEYVEGKTLRQRMGEGMNLSAVLDVAIQIATALAAAHQAGIVHRDIKPENIMIRRDGYVKVLDFGLAKLSEEHSTSTDVDAATVPMLETEPGMIIGTYVYMSPEQTRGIPADQRADIWSLGVVIYEMTAGRPPFEGATKSDMIVSILEKEPPPLARYAREVPSEFQRIVTKALTKDREERYQTVKDLLIDLRRLQRELEFEAKRSRSVEPELYDEETVIESGVHSTSETGRKTSGSGSQSVGSRASREEVGIHTTSSAEYIVEGIKHHKLAAIIFVAVAVAAIGAAIYFTREDTAISSVAVLPLVNANADPNMEYLSDGITESLINSLSRIPDLKVMARSSVFRYKGKEVDPKAVGNELGVQAVLTGRLVERNDDTITISLELVNARDNSHIWGDQYNTKLSEIIAMQGEMAKDISKNLRLKLTGEEKRRLTQRYTDNIAAYQLYLKGRYAWNKRTEDELKRSAEHFQHAIDLDPSYALAYAGLADSYNMLADYSVLPPKEAFPRAEAAAAKALEMDDTLAEAHTSLAFVKMAYDGDWAGAEREYRRAIELNPNYATAHQWYASLLVMMRRFDESITEMKRAQALDPLSRIINANLGLHYYYARQYDQAIEQLRKTINLEPDFGLAYFYLGRALAQKGMYKEAIAELQKARDLSGEDPETIAELGYAYGLAGRRAEAQKVLDELNELSKRRYVLPYFIATVHTGLGDKDQAFEWLEKAYAASHPGLALVNVDPKFDTLRSDPRFADLVRRIGLTQ